jgi:bacteriocin biosynthesis cyclodehydratase domain-containing protein
MLRAGLLPVWRDRYTVQVGIDPRRAVAISGLGNAAEVIRLLDGSRDREQVIAAASQTGVPPEVTEQVIALLAGAGALVDQPAGMLRAIPAELRRQLMPVLATASLTGQDGDGGARILARRAATTVEVCGSGEVARLLADLLCRSGVATVITPPGGTWPADSRRLVGQPDLLVLVGHQAPAVTTTLLRRKQAHLAVYAGEAIGIVGPLVRPGLTACLRCLDLARVDRDPAWPLILAQLAGRAADPPACDAVLAAAVASQAAAQAVAFADQSALAQATASATLELVLPAWQWRRRSWPPHPACTCGSCEQANQTRRVWRAAPA